MFHKKSVLKNFAKFTDLGHATLLEKIQVFSCEFSETFKSTFVIEHLRWLLLTLVQNRQINHGLTYHFITLLSKSFYRPYEYTECFLYFFCPSVDSALKDKKTFSFTAHSFWELSLLRQLNFQNCVKFLAKCNFKKKVLAHFFSFLHFR